MEGKIKVIGIAVACMLCGCSMQQPGTVESTGQDTAAWYLDVLDAATEEVEESTMGEEMFRHIGAGSGYAMNILKEEDQILIGNRETYNGEEMTFTASLAYDVTDSSVENVTEIVMLLNNGIPQPFYWGDSEEEAEYFVIKSAREEAAVNRKYAVRYLPKNVPYGDTAHITLLVSHMIDQNFSFPGTICVAGSSGCGYDITADAPEHEVIWEEEILQKGGASTYVRGAEAEETWDIAVTTALVSDSQLSLNSAITVAEGEPLYGIYSLWKYSESGREDNILYAFVDGYPAPLFDGSYYCRMSIEPGGLYEIPLDTEQLTKGDHLIWIAKIESRELTEPSDMEDGAGYGAGCGSYVYDIIIE